MFLSTVLKKCFDGFCVDGAIHVDTIGTILVSNCWIFIVRIMASCAVYAVFFFDFEHLTQTDFLVKLKQILRLTQLIFTV